MNLVHKQTGSPSIVLKPPAGRLDHLPQFLHPRGRRRELNKPPPGFGGNDLGKRRLSDPWRTVEDHRAEPICLNQATE